MRPKRLLLIFLVLTYPPAVFADPDIPYEVSITGVEDRVLRNLLEAVSETVSRRDRPPATRGLLERRVREDIPRLEKALRSYGFFDPRITTKTEMREGAARVLFHVEPGRQYLLGSVELEITGPGKGLVEIPSPGRIGLDPGSPFRSRAVLDAEKELRAWFNNRGFPFTETGEPDVVVDHATKKVRVEFVVETGPRVRFGFLRIQGLETVQESFLESRLPWKRGDYFELRLVREAEKQLIDSGLFALVQVKYSEEMIERDELPMVLEVRERKHRTVKAGLSYTTDEGPGGKVSWEHRNFLGEGERLDLSGNFSELGYGGEGKFRRPVFLHPEQSLVLNARLADDRTDAFDSRNITGLGEVERRLAGGITLAAGLGYRFSRIEQLGTVEYSGLLFLPLRYEWDGTDNLLDATRGGYLNTWLSPYLETYGENETFAKGRLVYSHYLKLADTPRLVLALRGALGVIGGAEREEVPADIRFYAGGGGSIRGYPFQSVGPLAGTEPIGGRSVFEFSSEFRIRLTPSLGLVTFLDGGSAFEAAYPDFEEDILWGAGIGVRYFTAIGPLRLDVGFPLNRRNEIDDAFQVYVSIGQAF